MRITKLHLIVIGILIAGVVGFLAKKYYRQYEERRKAALEYEWAMREAKLREEIMEEQKRTLEEERKRLKTILAQEAIAVAGEYWTIARQQGKDIAKGQETLRLAKETLSNENNPDKAWELAQQAITELKDSKYADITYRVKSGDTLWKISAMKTHFSDGKKWKYIYLANKQKIKNPRRIYPRQNLVVPISSWEKYKSDVNKIR